VPVTEGETVPDYTATYLNDHLAGSVGALDLLAHLAEQHAGTDAGEFFGGALR